MIDNSVYSLIIESCTETFFVIDRKFKIIYADNRFETWLEKIGRKSKKVLQNTLKNVLGEQIFDEILPFYKKIFEKPSKSHYEFKILQNNNTLIINLDFIPNKLEDCSEIITTIRNVTHEQLHYYEQDLEIQASKIISMISSILLSQNIDESISNSLETLVDVLECESISIIHYYKVNNKFTGQLKWRYPKTNIELFDPEVMTKPQNKRNKELLKKLQIDLYLTRTLESDPESKEIFEKFNFTNLLIVPIFIGKEPYGEIIANHPDPKKIWQKHEIQIVLTTSILIGLALKNYNQQAILNSMFDALSNMNLGAFILQSDQFNTPRFVYVNQRFKDILGYTDNEIHQMNMLEIISEEHRDYIKEMYYNRQKGKEFKSSYRLKVIAKSGTEIERPVVIGVGKLNDQPASFGIVLDLAEDSIIPVEEIFENQNH